jgi:hypothetical protein
MAPVSYQLVPRPLHHLLSIFTIITFKLSSMVNQVSFSKRTMGEADDSKFESTYPDDMETNAKNDDCMRRLISNATTIQFDTRNLEHNLSSFTTASKGSSSYPQGSSARCGEAEVLWMGRW